MNAAKNGIIANFNTGYLQREIRLIATVAGGTDAGLRDSSKVGYAVGRLVVVSSPDANGVSAITASNATSSTIGNATHIIAQSDDTIRDDYNDFNYTERYTTLPNLVCKNSATTKTVAVYKITDASDIKLINLG